MSTWTIDIPTINHSYYSALNHIFLRFIWSLNGSGWQSRNAASLQDKPQGMLKVLARLQVAGDLTRHRPWGIQGIGDFFNVVDVSFNNMGISIVMGDPQVMLALFPWENPNLIAGWFKASPISGNLHTYQLIDGVWRAWGNMYKKPSGQSGRCPKISDLTSLNHQSHDWFQVHSCGKP